MVDEEHSNRVEKIVIVGGGSSGWMTAASLIKDYKKTITITLIESSEIHTVGVGEATTPTIRTFVKSLGLTDFDVLKYTSGTGKLGILFKDWYKKGQNYFHPFGLYGQSVRQVPFHNYWTKLYKKGCAGPIGDYCLATTLAKNHKFALPSDRPVSPLSVFDWAYHFDAGNFADLLRHYSVGNGVTHIDAKVDNVDINPETGFIDGVLLGNGRYIEGDLFIDCSGFNSILLGKALGVPYQSWGYWLPTDSAVTVKSEAMENPVPYTISTAHKSGWQWTIPLQNRTGNGLVYTSSLLSDQEALDLLVKKVDTPVVSDPMVIKFTPGRREKSWFKNCIGVGLSAGFIEPLESTSIALIETAIEKIKMLFPDKSMNESLVEEFNEMTRLEYERVRDFIILHYCLSQRDDGAMWEQCRSLEIPDPLEHKLEVFRERGHIIKYRWEIFQPPSWLSIYAGNNIIPRSYDPRVDTFEDSYLRTSFLEIKKSLINYANSVLPNNEFINKNLRN